MWYFSSKNSIRDNFTYNTKNQTVTHLQDGLKKDIHFGFLS